MRVSVSVSVCVCVSASLSVCVCVCVCVCMRVRADASVFLEMDQLAHRGGLSAFPLPSSLFPLLSSFFFLPSFLPLPLHCAKAILAAASIMQDSEDYDVALVKYRISAGACRVSCVACCVLFVALWFWHKHVLWLVERIACTQCRCLLVLVLVLVVLVLVLVLVVLVLVLVLIVLVVLLCACVLLFTKAGEALPSVHHFPSSARCRL